VRSEGFYVTKNSNDTSWDRTSDLRFVAQHLNHCATSVPKIVIDNKIIEQVSLFNCLGNISYEGEMDIDNKLNKFLKITCILNVFRPQKPLRKQE